MRTATLMIAMSLDGYIADRQRSVAWLPEEQEEGSGSYEDFIRGIDTVVIRDDKENFRVYSVRDQYVLQDESLDATRGY